MKAKEIKIKFGLLEALLFFAVAGINFGFANRLTLEVNKLLAKADIVANQNVEAIIKLTGSTLTAWATMQYAKNPWVKIIGYASAFGMGTSSALQFINANASPDTLATLGLNAPTSTNGIPLNKLNIMRGIKNTPKQKVQEKVYVAG